ncbi:branched-chain-amino-acid aminotransferase [Rhizoctonia solani 123E]|uniref:branched-chain-amino-acid transaminase n=2 Tax=Rhizoctonia solani AG-3 TaxID=1086053 RepID=A0A074S6E7_9AGAM|nr:branched-chain-amino-acid aminotransferase [Rhizoctonia solani 123E]
MASFLRATLRSQLKVGTKNSYSQTCRLFSTSQSRLRIDIMTGEPTALPDIESSQLKIHKNPNPKNPPKSSSLVFGHTFTDHMISIPWNALSGWNTPTIIPYGPLSLDPSCTVLHYAQTVFEGMKAYRDENNKVTMFRPDMNMKRMNRSAARISLPTFNGDEMLEIIKTLVKLDSHWIPQEPGHSLYIRPTMIGTQRALGVAPPTEALLFVICSPVGPYYKNGFKPVRLLATSNFIRAAPGGTGGYKLGANYAPGVVPQVLAAKQGYDQNLWLIGDEHYLTEVGTMNLLVVFKHPDGTTELTTPPLEDLILPGVTRDSILALARDHESGKARIPGLPDNLKVSERHVKMAEVKAAAESGNLLEAFGAGTAAIVCPVKAIGYQGKDINIPVGDEGMGPVCKAILDQIVARQMGTVESDWSVVVTEGTKGSLKGPNPVA